MKERTEGTVDRNKICAHLSIAFCSRLCLHFLLCVNIFLIFFLEVLIFFKIFKRFLKVFDATVMTNDLFSGNVPCLLNQKLIPKCVLSQLSKKANENIQFQEMLKQLQNRLQDISPARVYSLLFLDLPCFALNVRCSLSYGLSGTLTIQLILCLAFPLFILLATLSFVFNLFPVSLLLLSSTKPRIQVSSRITEVKSLHFLSNFKTYLWLLPYRSEILRCVAQFLQLYNCTIQMLQHFNQEILCSQSCNDEIYIPQIMLIGISFNYEAHIIVTSILAVRLAGLQLSRLFT